MRMQMLFRHAALWTLATTMAMAHCDGLDGPVVVDARRAFAENNVSRVLLWVKKADESAIREAFAKAQQVRKLGGEAEKLAELYFFETLVRLHRASEGEPYTGLKPAGRDLGPAIPVGDKAVESGDLKPVWTMIQEGIHNGLHRRFDLVQKTKAEKDKDSDSGRRYVAAYVDYIHYVVNVHELGTSRPEPENQAKPKHTCGTAE